MRAILICLLFLFSLSVLLTPQTHAQQPTPVSNYYKGKVVAVTKEGTKDVGGTKNIFQNLKIRLLEGPDKDKDISVEYGGTFTITQAQKVSPGETVILMKTEGPDKKVSYRIADRYRLPMLLYLILAFFAAVIVVAGRKGAGAVIGLVISLAVIIFFIVPQILSGSDPLFISIIGSLVILVTTIYLAHGFNRHTHIALVATCASLFLTALLSILFVRLAQLSGLGTEDAYSLQQMFKNTINFQGLLLGGIIIGSLGVLDDVTTTQATTIDEFAKADEKSTMQTLIKKGMVVGRTHIASVVNTLVLAYAGASIGIFIFLVLGVRNDIQPLWVILNSEVIAEEVVRSLAGSIGLVLAVPITTILAAFFAKYSVKIK
jgi:uncharacterized membrane protein